MGLEGVAMRNSTESGTFRLQLTPREEDVLRHLLVGATNKEIAGDLACSVKTIEYHVSNLLRKSGVSSRLELVVSTLRGVG